MRIGLHIVQGNILNWFFFLFFSHYLNGLECNSIGPMRDILNWDRNLPKNGQIYLFFSDTPSKWGGREGERELGSYLQRCYKELKVRLVWHLPVSLSLTSHTIGRPSFEAKYQNHQLYFTPWDKAWFVIPSILMSLFERKFWISNHLHKPSPCEGIN